MFERTSRRSNNPCAGLVCAYPSTRDRPFERNVVHRSNENAHLYDRRESASIREESELAYPQITQTLLPIWFKNWRVKGHKEAQKSQSSIVLSVLLVARRPLPFVRCVPFQ